jgi:two-component system, OmpR family, response regulator
MHPRPAGSECRYIVVADGDRTVANFVIETLTGDGHAVFQAYDGQMALYLALGLKVCDLVISNTLVGGIAGPDLVDELRLHLPDLPIVYLADHGQSGPELEGRLPDDVPILREPFTTEGLRATVHAALLRGPGRC